MPKETPKWFCPYRFSLLMFFLFFLFAFIAAPPLQVWQGFVRILFSRSLLVTDYIHVGGLGGALLNAGLSGCMAVATMKLNKVAPNGAIIMAIWLTTGFSFFGKNVLNILPILLGVWLYARFQKEPFMNYSLIALLSTTLAPVVSEFAFLGRWNPWLALLIALFAGIVVGIMMPIVASAVTRVHGGYDLYNGGFAGGMVALFIMGFCNSTSIDIQRPSAYSSGNNLILAIFLYLVMVCWLLLGICLPGPGRLGKNVKKILGHSGRLVTDYYLLYGKAAFVNMGLLGIFATTLVLVLGGQLNGAALAGIFTIMGFGAFGKHLKNITPVLVGAIIMAAINTPKLASPGNITTILFSTGLAPIAGQYGWVWGIIAGVLHMMVAGHIGQLTGGLNLYNNGFAAGFVALVLVPFILAFKRGRQSRET